LFSYFLDVAVNRFIDPRFATGNRDSPLRSSGFMPLLFLFPARLVAQALLAVRVVIKATIKTAQAGMPVPLNASAHVPPQ
jgi:hypothetical protein